MRTQIYLTAADHGRVLSWEAFASADAEEGYRYEMIEGRVFVSPAANAPHNAFEIWLQLLLSAYAREHPKVLQFVTPRGRVFLPDLAEGITAPEPDVACYAEYAANPYAPARDPPVSDTTVSALLSPYANGFNTIENPGSIGVVYVAPGSTVIRAAQRLPRRR